MEGGRIRVFQKFLIQLDEFDQLCGICDRVSCFESSFARDGRIKI